MKNKIRYYYNFNDFSLTRIKDCYYFRYQNILYSFERIENIEYFQVILSILKSIPSSRFFKVVPNIYNDDFCTINNQVYALFMHRSSDFSLYKEIINFFYP